MKSSQIDKNSDSEATDSDDDGCCCNKPRRKGSGKLCKKKLRTVCSHETKKRAPSAFAEWTKFDFLSNQLKRASPVQLDLSNNPGFHVEIYCFAEEKLIQSLKACALAHLSGHLDHLKYGNQKDEIIVELAANVYDNTSHHDSSETGDDKVRELMVVFLAAKFPSLRSNPKFITLLYTHTELATDLLLQIRE